MSHSLILSLWWHCCSLLIKRLTMQYLNVAWVGD